MEVIPIAPLFAVINKPSTFLLKKTPSRRQPTAPTHNFKTGHDLIISNISDIRTNQTGLTT